MRWLTAIPIYNEVRHIETVLDEVRLYSPNILVVDDGSTDGSSELLAGQPDIRIVTHTRNRGYGSAIRSMFDFAINEGFDALVTIDCDGQHEPCRIPLMLESLSGVDIASGSRYLREFKHDTAAPGDRRRINQIITKELNAKYELSLTDSFCGFKAYCTRALKHLRISEAGWGMPLQLWVQAARLKLRIREVGVPRMYVDPSRTFGVLNDEETRLAYYRSIIASAAHDQVAPCAPEWSSCTFIPQPESCS